DSLYEEKIRAIVRRRLKDKYVIRHHRTIENRGLLTQTIHNAVLDKAIHPTSLMELHTLHQKIVKNQIYLI
ncbi:MAG: hypothetical protein ACKPFA_39925, partial [Dolichospermum sp.]